MRPPTHGYPRPILSIVPPHILEAIARNGTPDQRERALRTLSIDTSFRTARLMQLARGVKRPSAPTVGPPSKQRSIYTAHNTTTLPGTLVRGEGQPASGDAAVDEAYDGLGATFDLYYNVYGRNSIDDAGMALLGTVHYGQAYDNAFWNSSQMVFGDGDGQYFNRFTISVDIMGHELTHGVTGDTAQLEYHDQPGALNESISDVFGSLVKQYAHSPQQTAAQADWLIGAGLFTAQVNGVALRSMSAPGTAYDDPVLGKDPQPADMANYVNTTSDNGGVHINSGIPNHAFYLLAAALGGYAWDKAGLIWYKTLLDSRLSASASFQDFANLTADNAASLFGAVEQEAVVEAWHEVGIEVQLAGGGWSQWASEGGILTTDIAVGTNSDGRLEVYGRGTDGAMWHDWQVAPNGGWSGWASEGGILTSPVAIAVNADGRQEAFVRGTDSTLWHKWQLGPNGTWSGWVSEGGVLTSDVAAARNADGRLEIFVRGTDGALWHNWQLAAGGSWSGWASEGGILTSDIAVGVNADGRLEVFVRGTDEALWHNWQLTPGGGWSGWASEGGILSSDIAVGRNADGRLEVFVTGTDSGLWHKWQVAPNGGWSGWATEGGILTSRIAVAQNADGRLEVFARGTDFAMWHNWQVAPNGTWSGWASEGGILSSDIAVGRDADGRLEAFVTGTDFALWHKWQTRALGAAQMMMAASAPAVAAVRDRRITMDRRVASLARRAMPPGEMVAIRTGRERTPEEMASASMSRRVMPLGAMGTSGAGAGRTPPIPELVERRAGMPMPRGEMATAESGATVTNGDAARISELGGRFN